MSASIFIRGPKLLAQLHNGSLGNYIDLVATRFIDERFSRTHVITGLTTIGVFGQWLDRSGLAVRDIDERLIDRFLCDGSIPVRFYARGALRKLLAILRERGDAPPAPVVIGPNAKLERDFEQLADGRLVVYDEDGRIIHRFQVLMGEARQSGFGG